jgi:hypothetical protein
MLCTLILVMVLESLLFVVYVQLTFQTVVYANTSVAITVWQMGSSVAVQDSGSNPDSGTLG